MENKFSIIRTRIKREFELLIEKNICIENDITIYQDLSSSYAYSICFKNLQDNKYYKFIIPHNYPYKPPKLYINNNSIMLYNETKYFNYHNLIKKYNGISCFCCETMLCGNHFSPQFTFTGILDNINTYQDTCKQKLLTMIIDIIKKKYLINDINIIEWLY